MTSGPTWTDAHMVERMSSGYADRYPQTFWDFFETQVRPHIGDAPKIVDLGCGPGLLLQDFSSRLPMATLAGIDSSTSMLEKAKELDYEHAHPSFTNHDLNQTPYPLDDHSIHLCTSASVVCFLSNPMLVLRELERVLAPGGVYMLYDWRRQSLEDYVVDRGGIGQDVDRLMSVQAYHNRFSVEDWYWILHRAGFEVIGEAHPRSNHVLLASVFR